MLMPRTFAIPLVDVAPGSPDIFNHCRDALVIARDWGVPVRFEFNGVTVLAFPEDDPNVLCARWQNELLAASRPHFTSTSAWIRVPPSLDLEERIRAAINATSAENASGTPDFILAAYLTQCLEVFNRAVYRRAEWHGTTKVTMASATNPKET